MTTSLTARVLLSNQLRAQRGEVDWTVVSGDDYEDPPPGVEVAVIPIRREFAVSDIAAFIKLLRFLRGRHFDLVQTHTPKASFLGLPTARLAGSPALYTIHGSLYFSGNGRWANVLGWLFERWCCTWADRVLVQSREDEVVLPAVRIVGSRKLAYVGNGIDMDRFAAPAPAASGGSDLPVVLMVSRLVLEKGCADFIEVAAALGGEAHFVHVGPSEHDQSDALPDSVIAEAAEAGSVSFVGPVEDVRPHLASASVVVLPSYREGIPRVAMEAAACGKPVVAYDIRGMREVIDPATGLLAPRGDVSVLTAIVQQLLKDPDRRAEVGARCREHVVERFSEELVFERLRAVYNSVAGARGSAARRSAARRSGARRSEARR